MKNQIEPIRLLKIVPTLLCGGTENQFMTIGRSLDPSRFDLTFACLRRWGPFVNELEARQLPLLVYNIKSFLRVSAFRQQARFARDITARRIQIVHAYNFYGNVFAIPPARLASTPVVIASIRDCGPYLTPMQKRVQRYACHLADCVLVNADAVKDWLIHDGYPPSKITVIRNGVDLSRFNQPPDPGRIRHEFGLPDATPLVLVVSRLARLKGLEPFLEAAAIVRRQHPDVRFLVAGETSPFERPYLDELTARAARLGLADRVVFTGLRSDVPALLASATISVMPSLNEALSNVLLESMAAGAPVVATRVGGTPEVVADGESGLLVPPADPISLAAAITRLLDDPELAARLGAAGQATVRQKFSVERMVDATDKLYMRLLTEKLSSSQRALVDRRTSAREVTSANLRMP